MNIYFLLEGRSTEKKVYGAWLQYLLPEFQRVKFYDDAQDRNYFLISAHGYPSIIHEYIPDAINRIKETGQYQYLVVCLDAEEDTVESKKQEIDDFIKNSQTELGSIKLIPIIQNRCIETWFLGNRKMFDSRQTNIQIPLAEYVRYSLSHVHKVQRWRPQTVGGPERERGFEKYLISPGTAIL